MRERLVTECSLEECEPKGLSLKVDAWRVLSTVLYHRDGSFYFEFFGRYKIM